MADRRPKNMRYAAGQSSSSAKRRAPDELPSGPLQPTQHPPPPSQSPRMAFESFQKPALPQQSRIGTHEQQRQGAKMAIPRLRRDSDGVSAAGSSVADKHRVSHACEPCRHRKTKCSGDQPSCKHCEDFKITCTYADGKRDRVKRELGSMASKVEDRDKMLRFLFPRLEASDQALVQRFLEEEASPDAEEKRSIASPTKSFFFGPPKEENEQEGDGESQVSAGIGSNGSLDRIKEDFNRTPLTRATGYIGKNSEVTWMQRLKEQAKGDPPNQGPKDPDTEEPAPAVAIHEATYHCDDLMLLSSDEVDAYELPPKRAADMLFQNYLETVHATFPFIGKTTFASQYQTLYENNNIRPGANWLAILNLIFAIGAKYSHLIQTEWRGDERDHLIYFTRARVLAMNGESLFSHPDLQQVQVAALMSFYLMATNQINRAWTMSGIAVRYAITLGLNLENHNGKLSDTSKEIRYRVWWALYSVEGALAVMTGRPVSVIDSDCNTPLPVPVDEDAFPGIGSGVLYANARHRPFRRVSSGESRTTENTTSSSSSGYSSRRRASPTSSMSPISQLSSFVPYKNIAPSKSLFFLLHIQLTKLTNEVLIRLYRAGTMSQSWADVQRTIASLDQSLEKWRGKLPSLFDFTKKQRDQQFISERISLGFSYYGTKIIINRPCLCRVDCQIPNESDHCREFNKSTATACILAARNMLDLLPEQPNPVGLYKVAPWWSLLHHLMQAATVLMLELSLQVDHMPFEAETILSSARKAAQWLHKMAADNVSARRAWNLCSDMLRHLAPKVGRTADGLPGDIPNLEHHSNSDPQNSYASVSGEDGVSVEDGNSWGGMQSFSKNFPNQFYYGGPQSERHMFFNSPMYTPYDEYLQRDGGSNPMPTTSMSSIFPSSAQMTQMVAMTVMDPMSDGVADMPDFFFNPAPQWDPKKGPR
ncbi:MAG: hypothetical protein FRX48_06969 [Lasallia pustulata]|uniref:Zn(2)-C6 fungal-type domain-containing protein n=1 Tax=Lasallia pustulata TaxID=136370 RepID=A0A5M8PKZ0_9LECA|nr:MAG: hypothetical protein FRX48_06969 [Lasallia pustulata]